MSAKLTRAERRARILASATRIFSARGYGYATTRELAQAAGITEPVMYTHFAGKKILFDAVLEQGRENRLAKLRDGLNGQPLDTPVDLLRSLSRALLEIYRTTDFWFELSAGIHAARERSGPIAGDWFAAEFDAVLRAITETLNARGLQEDLVEPLLLRTALVQSVGRALFLDRQDGEGERELRAWVAFFNPAPER